MRRNVFPRAIHNGGQYLKWFALQESLLYNLWCRNVKTWEYLDPGSRHFSAESRDVRWRVLVRPPAFLKNTFLKRCFFIFICCFPRETAPEGRSGPHLHRHLWRIRQQERVRQADFLASALPKYSIAYEVSMPSPYSLFWRVTEVVVDSDTRFLLLSFKGCCSD